MWVFEQVADLVIDLERPFIDKEIGIEPFHSHVLSDPGCIHGREAPPAAEASLTADDATLAGPRGSGRVSERPDERRD